MRRKSTINLFPFPLTTSPSLFLIQSFPLHAASVWFAYCSLFDLLYIIKCVEKSLRSGCLWNIFHFSYRSDNVHSHCVEKISCSNLLSRIGLKKHTHIFIPEKKPWKYRRKKNKKDIIGIEWRLGRWKPIE